MSERKNRRETDKAIRHLIEYEGPNSEWAGRLDELEDEFLAPVADKLDLSLDEAFDYFFDGPFGHMAFGGAGAKERRVGVTFKRWVNPN
jgi:hypothetical protein